MKRFFVIILVVAVLAAILYARTTAPPPATDSAQPSVQVTTIQLRQTNVPAIVSAYGSIAAGPGAERTITTQAGGIVAAMRAAPGQPVAAGAELAVITADPQSVATLQKAETALSAAQASRAHVAALLASHLATRTDLATADQALSDAAGALAAARATGIGTRQTITAPAAGVVSAVLAAPGALLAAGSPLLRIIDTRELVAIIGVPPAQAATVTPDQPATLTLLNTGAILAGQVTASAAMPDPQTGLTDVTLSLAGPAPLGQPVQAAITTGTLTGYAVPRDAVQNDSGGDYVFQVDTDNIAHRVGVHVLGSVGAQAVLAADFSPAMRLVTTGAYQLDDGTRVRADNAGGASN